MKTAEPQDAPALGTEQAVDSLAKQIKADLERGTELIRQGHAIWSYVAEHTDPWLEGTPGLLKTKCQEIALMIETVTKDGDAIEGRMKRSGKPMPEVQVHKGNIP